MPSLRNLNNRISSLENMQKVMNAMNMIASAKLGKKLKQTPAVSFFESTLKTMHNAVSAALDNRDHPLAQVPDQIDAAHIMMFSADKGLCGSHNSSVFKQTILLAAENLKESNVIDLTCIGQKGASFCRKQNFNVDQEIAINEIVKKPAGIRPVAGSLTRRVLRGDIQELWLVYNRFVSVLVQETTAVRIFPLLNPEDSEFQGNLYAEFEPEINSFLPVFAELYLYFQIRLALNHSFVSEQAARMNAMDNAAHNARDLISRYGGLRNRLRQSGITNDLIEIVAGKEALKDK